jgi:FtsH-binding integral membrane protein
VITPFGYFGLLFAITWTRDLALGLSGALSTSAVFVLLMSGLVPYQTSSIIHGGETSYIMATVTLFVSTFNRFTSLLHSSYFPHLAPLNLRQTER